MSNDAQPEPRPRKGTHSWAAWASRVVLAVMFAFGMIGTAGRSMATAESEPTEEIGEDGEVIAHEHELGRTARRHAHRGGARWAQLAWARPPERLEPTVRAPEPPRWQRPRRAPPPGDDDGTSIG